MKEVLRSKKWLAAAGFTGVAALAGCSSIGNGSFSQIDQLDTVSSVTVGDSVHYGITGKTSNGHNTVGLTSHLELSCNPNGELPPTVTVMARTLVANSQRFETVRQVNSKKEQSCSDYLVTFGPAAALDEFSKSYYNSARELFGYGHIVNGQVIKFANSLLEDAANGTPVRDI